MKTIHKSCAVAAAAAAVLLPASVRPAPAAEAGDARPPVVQIALLLDTSNSMDGLIDQARGQLWTIVNEFIHARQNGRRPELQVALYEYGNTRLRAAEGWIRQVLPLTTDFDKVSEELFGLKTKGGDEYCGWVIKNAVEQLAWSSAADVYKAIFIAGNEPFTQGPVSYADACKTAIAKGIVVNTIHCGREAEGIDGKWRDGAMLADGKFMVIDHNRAVVHFEAPQDQEIARLGTELNKTYLAYGRSGQASQLNQAAQDRNAAVLAAQGAPVQRALSKASANYRNDHWDLVDACQDNRAKLAEVKREELPVEMQSMTEAERATYVEAKAKERAQIQARITKLNEERNQFLAGQQKQPAAANTLDTVMISAIREQAARQNFRFE